MALNKYKLGDLIVQRREKNKNYNCPIKGVSKDGFIDPKQKNADTSLYNVFYKYDFVFNPARMEINSIALNTTWDKCICSSLYEIFYIKDTNIILPEFLNLFVKRNEFARRCDFIGSGSAREYCRVGNISEFDIEVPDIDIQQKYVNIYNSILNNLRFYEKGLDDLKLICDGYIEKLRKEYKLVPLKEYIEITDRKTNNDNLEIRGISNKKEFIIPNSRVEGVLKSKYLRIDHNEFGYSPIHINEGAIALNFNKESYLLSPIYKTFKVINEDILDPTYLMIFFSRKEFIRYCWFNAFGSARDTIEWSHITDYKIPIPSIKIQNSISKIYSLYKYRKNMCIKLTNIINTICPILIKGAIEEARGN